MVPHHKCKRGKAGWSQLLRFIPKKLKWRPLDWNVSMLLIWMGEVQLCVFIAGIKSVLFKSKYHFYLKAFPFYMLGRNQWSIWPMRSLLLLSSYHRTHTGKLFLEPSSSGQVHNLTAPSLIGLLTVSLASREDGHITGVSNKSRRLPPSPPHPATTDSPGAHLSTETAPPMFDLRGAGIGEGKHITLISVDRHVVKGKNF